VGAVPGLLEQDQVATMHLIVNGVDRPDGLHDGLDPPDGDSEAGRV
jgi:hypothetical protein